MSWKDKVKNWDGKLYKVLQGNKSCHGGNFEWSLPRGDKPGDWTPIIEDVEMCKRGYHLTTHYAHWSNRNNISIYEAEGDVVEFDDYDKVVCTRARLLRLIENSFPENNSGDNNSGCYNTGNCNSGDGNTGNGNLGDRNSGKYNFGNYNSGNYNTGFRNSGNYNLGNWNSGNWNSGNWNSGSWNSGSWNSGCGNSGYFCTCHGCNEIFNKPIPENWKPKFPEWIYTRMVSCILAESF